MTDSLVRRKRGLAALGLGAEQAVLPENVFDALPFEDLSYPGLHLFPHQHSVAKQCLASRLWGSGQAKEKEQIGSEGAVGHFRMRRNRRKAPIHGLDMFAGDDIIARVIPINDALLDKRRGKLLESVHASLKPSKQHPTRGHVMRFHSFA
jgi:hypothetical protein